MNGDVFEGVVVRTTQIAAGKELPGNSVQKSEIVYTSAPLVAKDLPTATGMILAAAIAKGVAADDPAAPVEVRVRKYAA